MVPRALVIPAEDNIDIFCRAVEARSEEHRQAMDVALDRGWWAIAGSVLRMELDSMIRVIYLLRRPDRRDRILASCVAGEGFKYGQGYISDQKMIAVATRDNGWVDAVYEFGNKFVHLTDAHDYAEVDPLQAYEHRGDVIKYLNDEYRGKVPGRRLDDSSTLRDIAAYAPHVLDKITSNLSRYTEDLRTKVGHR